MILEHHLCAAFVSILLMAPHVYAQDSKPQPKLTLIGNVNIFGGVTNKLHFPNFGSR
jgi:hypothetical protein